MAFFGQASAAQPASGFGSTATGFNTTPKPGGFSFGSLGNVAPGSTSTSTAPSLFGTAVSNTSTPSFGMTATSQPQQQTGGFGTAFGGGSSQPTLSTTFNTSTSAPASNTLGGTTGTSSLFGNNTSLFGNTGSGNTTGLFSSSSSSFNKPAGGFGGFGGSNLQGLNTNISNMTPQQRDKMIYELLVQKDKEDMQQRGQRTLNDVTPENIWQSLALMKSWWDPESPNCRFKTYFYNMVPAQEVHLYQRPPHHDPKAWEEAQKKNPDPSCMVPTLAIGFNDVSKRMEAQDIQSQAHKAKLLEIDQRIKKMQETTLQGNAHKLKEAKLKYMEITQRVIKFLKHTQVLRQKGLSITPEEEMMRTRFESIQVQLQQSEQFHGTLSQMWAQLQLIKESGRKYGSVDGVDEWDSVSPGHVEEITRVLDEQQRGIQHTIDVLEKDTKEIDQLQQQYYQSQPQESWQYN